MWAPARPEHPSALAAVVGSTAHQKKNEDAVVRLVNAARAQANVAPLQTDERLRTAARDHSKDMARRDFCAHNNPDGLTPSDRMRAAGYPQPGAENVAKGQNSPHSVMRAWMNSPGHRANLLNPEFTTIGVGAYFGRSDGPSWTQNFGY
ncbi:CAP domain-containing protein [Saccharopolyspora spinosa]|uniref:CAP domain-containing protein n=1 Tax=Saccharopolyspora spinosa TaxID=60894 RepID=UPI001EEE7903|nr:CAP domain-containing protein [Saccharopolyspora spinosa]